VKLTDFGIAKARGFLQQQEGEVVVGKPDYMSPEQANFEITDARSDLFSAGVVLAHLLLGRNIFRAETPEASRQRMLKLPIPDFRLEDERIDERLNGILHRTLRRSVEERYPCAREFLEALERYLYEPGFGPTNEKLGAYVRELFGQNVPRDPAERARGSTVMLPPRDSSARS
jgi:serine/threonine-protein kinase